MWGEAKTLGVGGSVGGREKKFGVKTANKCNDLRCVRTGMQGKL